MQVQGGSAWILILFETNENKHIALTPWGAAREPYARWIHLAWMGGAVGDTKQEILHELRAL